MQRNTTPPMAPVKAGPQPENQIAPTAGEQLHRALGPRPKRRPAPPPSRRLDAIERELAECRRLLGIALLRGSRG